MKLALYLTFPYPDRETFSTFFGEMIRMRFDYLELGIPTGTPYYDGPIIRRTHRKAMEGFSFSFLKKIVNVSRLAGKKNYALVYYNHFHSSTGKFLDDLKEAGIDGAIVPDLLTDYYDERRQLSEEMKKRDLSLIPFFTSSTPDSAIREMTLLTDSWIYHGLQPSTGIRVPVSIDLMVSRIRKLCNDREIIFGFGINSMEMVRELRAEGADGIAVGSSLVSYMDSNDKQGFRSEIEMLGDAVYD